METFFIVILIFMALLTVFDIFVGVSNDASNFLGPALGSKIASFKTVLLVASAGVLIGATFSGGMMEIARSGVFNPERFTFYEIMFVLFAVMVSDIMLLNIFNVLGFPTSTTVSIIFELLGGAVAMAMLSLWRNGESLAGIGGFINSEKALAIISGILISVVVAFVAGLIVQFLTRLIFTFHPERIYRKIGGLFCGAAMTAIAYFLFVKGAKDASFMPGEAVRWLDGNVGLTLLIMFAAFSVVFQGMILFLNANIFRIVILAGTFAIAFAFATNDLVNFVGVPLTALDSFKLFTASPLGPHELMMASLRGPVATPTLFLLAFGLVMSFTLWFSPRAHRVVQTSINLSSATRGEKEQFGSSRIGRLLVRGGLRAGQWLETTLPVSLLAAIDKRLEQPPKKKEDVALPFDHIRAMINLVVASILIASATSLRLPLSTTYVTFMVAMGSSFADGAWDRETAVYRISGVLMVIAGWFVTAVAAFSISATTTTVVSTGGLPVMAVLMVIVCIIIIRCNFINQKKPSEDAEVPYVPENADRDTIRVRLDTAMTENLDATVRLFHDGLKAFLDEDVSALKTARTAAAALSDDISKKRGEYYRMALEGGGSSADDDARHFYYRAFTNMKEVGHVLRVTLRQAEEHIANSHPVHEDVLRVNLERILTLLAEAHRVMDAHVHGKSVSEAELARVSTEQVQEITRLQFDFLSHLDEYRLSLMASDLYLGFLQFAREYVGRYSVVALLQRDFNERCRTARNDKESEMVGR